MKKLVSWLQMLCTWVLPGCRTNAFDWHLRSLYKQSVPFIQPGQLAAIYQKPDLFVLLDVRSPQEFAVSHLPNAKFVDYKTFDLSQVKDFGKDFPIIVYCSVGVRSELIGEKLQQAGYTNVRNLYGGLFAWINQGYQVVNNQNQPTEKVHAYNRYWGIWLKKGIKVYE